MTKDDRLKALELEKENDQLKVAGAQLLAEIAELKLALKEAEEAGQLKETRRCFGRPR